MIYHHQLITYMQPFQDGVRYANAVIDCTPAEWLARHHSSAKAMGKEATTFVVLWAQPITEQETEALKASGWISEWVSKGL